MTTKSPNIKNKLMSKLNGVALAAGMALLLSGCGGGGGHGSPASSVQPSASADTGGGNGGPTAIFPPTESADTGRGSPVGASPELVAQLSASDLTALLGIPATGASVVGAPKCGVETRYLEYRTVGGQGEPTNATAAVMIPTGSDAGCVGSRPVVLYAHGTTEERHFNMAKWTEPDQPAAGEGGLLAAMFAAQGFIVVAPNYAGYDKSTLSYHPYLNGDQQGKDMVDSLRAARRTFPSIGAADSGALLIAGYSEGGYVAMAAHREMQATGQEVTASSAMSAPTAISLLVDYGFSGLPALGATLYTPLITTSWQKQFGNIYAVTSDIYEAKYAQGLDTLLPGLTPADQLFALAKLPPLALLPADGTPGPIDPSLALFYGPDNLIKQSYLTQVANDIKANPCPGNGLPGDSKSIDPASPLGCKPALGLRQAAVANDLRNWLPSRPVMMCGGAADPSVNFASTRATAAYFRARGMTSAALAVVDLEESGLNDSFSPIRAGFAAAKTQVAASAGGSTQEQTLAVAQAYHPALVPPFCMRSTRDFFQAVLKSEAE